ncbi:MAG: flagellar basal body P-ring protein FlgI [Phycisphaerales bacterium]|nr:flagellar basal body P-ring protein FlgI [Phycisphaerales bacterium]
MAVVIGALCIPAQALKIRDVARLKNESPSSIIGYGLVVGLKGTGDGGDNALTITKLAALVRNLGDERTLERELKNNNNVAVVQVTVNIPAQGAHEGESLDAIVSSVGSAKSLRGGQLFLTPMILSMTDRTNIFAMASGECLLDDEQHPTRARVVGGAVMIKDALPDEIKDGRFTLVLHPNTANPETATAVADQINEDVKVQTGGKAVAFPVDSTSIDVIIPPEELKNVTQFISRVRSLPLPNIPDPAKVVIDTKTKTIVFTQEVELAPTTIIHGGMMIEIVPPVPSSSSSSPAGSMPQNTKLRSLMEAFRLYNVSPDDRIAIVRKLHDSNALKADLVIQ